MAYAGKVGHTAPPLDTMRGRNRPTSALATGVAVGLLVGAGVALLFAPYAGAETRHRMGRGFRRARLRGTDAWDDLRLELRHARRRFKRARRAAELGV